MAVIFYHQDTGAIYGVHSDSTIAVPNGIANITVPEQPDKIKWPQLPDGRPGSEHTSKVIGNALVVDLATIPPPKSAADVNIKELIAQMIADGTMTQVKIDAIKAAR